MSAPDGSGLTARRDDRATASINRDVEGTPLGATLFLGVEELIELGIDSESDQEIEYWVENGEIHVDSNWEKAGDE